MRQVEHVLAIDERMRRFMARWGILAVRLALGILYVWFGVLKLFDRSPIKALIEEAYPFLPYPETVYGLGALEVLIGAGLLVPLLPIASGTAGLLTRVTLGLLWIQLVGTVSPALLAPGRIWDDYPPLLTLEGEFVAKNIVLAAAGLAIGATVHPRDVPPALPGTLREAVGHEPPASPAIKPP
ncbi:MAG: hypothetical protein WEB00_12940 [Dehalococcoidia bacterium]